MGLLKVIIIIILLVYVFYTSTLYLLQDTILFFPVKFDPVQIREVEKKYPDFVYKSFSTPDNKTLTYWESVPAGDKIVFYFGGNAENTNLTVAEIASHIHITNSKWVLLNYPGYNGSSGFPSEKSFYEYAELLYKIMTEEALYKEIIFIGRSIGSGVASYLSSRVRCNKLILITPFDSVKNVAKMYYPFLLIDILLKHRFESYIYLTNSTFPVLILSAEKDEVIPEASLQNLLKTLSRNPFLKHYKIPGASHNSISQHPLYWKYLIEFINSDNK